VWSGETRREAMAWSSSFHIAPVLCAKQRFDTSAAARLPLAPPQVAEASRAQRAASAAWRSGGSPRAAEAFTADINRPSRSPEAAAIRFHGVEGVSFGGIYAWVVFGNWREAGD
jgi:hypothetical protein